MFITGYLGLGNLSILYDNNNVTCDGRLDWIVSEDTNAKILDNAHTYGRVIRYDIREYAMASISNGLAAYSPGCFLPITATLLRFYLYAAAGARMGALSGLTVIHIATHDSIGEGQNGPAHRVELDSLSRAMTDVQYIRPSDSEDVVGAWMAALGEEGRPSTICFARDPLTTAKPNANRDKIQRGGYVVVETTGADVTVVCCGSDLQFAIAAASELDSRGVLMRVVSMPWIQRFEEESEEYPDEVLLGFRARRIRRGIRFQNLGSFLHCL
jgi:dihydroxyacetone synthase